VSNAPIYLFDGICVLCSRGVNYVLRHEKQPEMRFVAIQSQEGRQLALDHDIDPENPQSFLFIENGQSYQLSDAVLAMAKFVGGPGRYFLWTRFVPRPLRDLAYGLVAKNRYRIFGKMDHCYVPKPDETHRFILN